MQIDKWSARDPLREKILSEFGSSRTAMRVRSACSTWSACQLENHPTSLPFLSLVAPSSRRRHRAQAPAAAAAVTPGSGPPLPRSARPSQLVVYATPISKIRQLQPTAAPISGAAAPISSAAAPSPAVTALPCPENEDDLRPEAAALRCAHSL
jgi:hypothetical protein